jgi:predicted dehydrogenase
MGKLEMLGRREFLNHAAAASACSIAAAQPPKKVRVGVIGCGNVSGAYLPDILSSPHIELVSVCDILFERARAAAGKHGVSKAYPNIDDMLAGEPFDLLVNITSMPSHYPVSRKALDAGRHVWSEKPMALTVADAGRLLALASRKGVSIHAAPTCVISPQFEFMARTIAAGKLGRVSAAHASYGHGGRLWSPWFFQKGGGSLYDLGVYNVTTLTGLLGPAKSVVGVEGTAIATRTVEGQPVKAEADDNTMLIIEHAHAVYSHIQTGYVYFSAKRHDDVTYRHRTIDIVGTDGVMHLVGYDWGPKGVDLAERNAPEYSTHATDPGSYKWQHGVSYLAECMVNGNKPLLTGTHALHVLEVMNACHESQRTGRRVGIRSTFDWPIFKA